MLRHSLAFALTMVGVTASLVLTGPLASQDAAPRPVTLRFRTAGDTTVIRGAVISIDHTIEAGTTDSLGIVTVPGLDDGGHIVEAVAKGYQAFFDNFMVRPNTPMPIEFEILAVVDAPKPKGVVTALTVAGFEARRAKAQGRFFTLAQLKAADGRPLSNLLKVDAGGNLVMGPNNESFLAARGAPSCRTAVVRDGLRVYPFESTLPPDLDKIFTDDLLGIEWYPKTPPELSDAGACGALILWSR